MKGLTGKSDWQSLNQVQVFARYSPVGHIIHTHSCVGITEKKKARLKEKCYSSEVWVETPQKLPLYQITNTLSTKHTKSNPTLNRFHHKPMQILRVFPEDC